MPIKEIKEREQQPPKRIIFENQDGSVRYIEGDQAKKWLDTIDGMTVLAYVHGEQGQSALASIKWKTAPSLNEVPTTRVR